MADRLTWEQKFDAIKALAGEGALVYISRAVEGSWYLHASGCEIARNGFLEGNPSHAGSPQECVEQAWLGFTEAPAVKVGGYRADAKYYRWNGYMWRECERPEDE